MGRSSNASKEEGKVSRALRFVKSGSATSTGQPTEGHHPEKHPIHLVYRRGVLISSSETDFGNSCQNSSTEFAKVEKTKESVFKFENKENQEETGERRRLFHSRKQTLRNFNSLENCFVTDLLTETKIESKVERKLSLPADINELLEKFDNTKMSSNGLVKSTSSQLHNKVTRQTDFITGFALVEACESNNERKLKDLVRKMCCMTSAEVGPLVNFQDQTGRTALSFACGFGNVVIIEELSQLRRLDPNLGDNDGNTPLHYAAQAGQSTAIDLLLLRFEGVIDPNCPNSTGLTPLHKAALQGRSRVAKSLIVAGASPHVRDYSRNLTAMEWARLCGRHICAEVIVRAARDNHCPSVGSPPRSYNLTGQKGFPTSQSVGELKRLNSDDSPFYHMQNARNTISGANWLKNKLRKAIGSSSSSSSMPRSESAFGLMSNLSGATLCAGSLILPSIKPIMDQQKPKVPHKIKIPTVQVTQVKR